jgi:isopenicillin N synthase-like dioxygenase
MYANNLPVIDFSTVHGDARARAELIAEIGRSGTDTGFFYLKNFGIEPMRIAQVFAQSRSFFGLPHERKCELLLDRTNRRYDGLEAPSFRAGQPGILRSRFDSPRSRTRTTGPIATRRGVFLSISRTSDLRKCPGSGKSCCRSYLTVEI